MTAANHKGFTLIEVIVVLMLGSVLMTAAGFGVVSIVRGYAFARENARMVQVAQLGLDRISRELSGLDSVISATATSAAVATPGGNRSIERFGTVIRMDEDATPADGATLVDRVSAFQLTYTNSTGNPWTIAQPVDQLMEIGITLTLSRTDGGSSIVFATAVTPRNNRTLNAPN